MKRFRIEIAGMKIEALGIPPVIPILIIVIATAGAVARLRGWI